MALNLDKEVFPTVFIKAFIPQLESDLGVTIKERRVTTDDPNLSVGIFADSWDPSKPSSEVMGSGFAGMHTSTINRYSVNVQGLVIDTMEDRGLRRHYALAAAIRATLAWREATGLALAATSVEIVPGHTESLRRWTMDSQKYYSSKLSSKWAYLSVLEITLETESRRS